MFSLSDPGNTRFDWRFRLLGTDVRVHPFFWLAILLLGGDQGNPWFTIYWVAIVFVSILVHEFGHVLAMRLVGDSGHIVLWGFGGLAISQKNYYRRHCVTDVAVSAAGPAAGLLLAALVAALAIARGGTSLFMFSSIGIPVWHVYLLPTRLAVTNYQAYVHLNFVVNTLLWVNFYWSLVNLLPVYPLDGGQITRAIFEQRDPAGGSARALRLSMVVALGIAGLAIFSQNTYLAFLFGFCAIGSYQALQSAGRTWRRS
jgi:stage IV sporulation protein FB